MAAAEYRGSQGDGALVGRESALARLARTRDEVAAGHVRTVVVSGPAGMGKTAVLEEFLRRTGREHPDTRFISAVGDAWERQLALAGYSQLMQTAPVRSAKAYDSGTGPAVGAVADGLTPTQAAHHAATFMVHLEALQTQGVAVVAVDDAHLLDTETLRILVFVMRRMRDRRVLFVLTVDPSRGYELPTDLLSGHRVRRLSLDPLDGEQVQELARAHRSLELTATAAQRLSEHTRGRPQPIVELLDELPDAVWSDWFPSLPASARMLAHVDARLADGGEDLLDVAHAVAALGGTTRFDVLHGVLDAGQEPLGPDRILAALDEAHEMHLLRVQSSDAPLSVTFVDPGAGEAVYDRIPPSRRQDLHRRAAGVVTDEAARLAHRVSATIGDDEDLAAELEDFAHRQSRAGAWQEVATALFAASRLSSGAHERSERLLRAVDALVGAGNIAHAQTWSAAVEALPASTPRSSVLGYLATASGLQSAAAGHLERAWESVDPESDPRTAATVAQRRVLHGLAMWDGHAITAWSAAATRLGAPEDPATVESQAIAGLGLFAQGRFAEAEAAYARAVGAAGESAQKQRVQMGAGWLALRLDDVETALMNFEAAAPVGSRGGSMRISLWAEAWLARTQLILGDWDAAAATVIRASARLEAAAMPLIGPLLYWTAAELWSMRGDWERARHYVALAAAHRGDYRVMRVPAQLARARFHEARAEYEAALEALRPLPELDPNTADEVSFWPWFDTYVNALVMTNRLEEARAFLVRLDRIRRERTLAADAARRDWAWGRLLAAEGEVEDALEHFESALARLEGIHRPYLRARISFAFGQSMRRAGKRRVASTALQAARELYLRLGASTYVERCDRELKATGMDGGLDDLTAESTAPAGGGAGEELTVQEQAVASLVASGATNKETARSLFLAEKTVQYHLTRIYRKLGVRSRSELAARYRDQP